VLKDDGVRENEKHFSNREMALSPIVRGERSDRAIVVIRQPTKVI
jgi:hypothetical protein